MKILTSADKAVKGSLEVEIEMTQYGSPDELLGWQRMGRVCWHNG